MPVQVIYIFAALLFFGAAPLPYGYYTLLRLIACGVFSFAAFIAHERKHDVLPWVYGIVAVLFNPFVKIYLPKEVWMFVDIGAGILLLVTAKSILLLKAGVTLTTEKLTMHEKKHAAIISYLAEGFQNCKIEQKHDFDRGAQTFKIFVPNDTLLLKVADEFVGDNSTPEIIRLFDLWCLPVVLCKEKKLGVLVTQQGLKSFRRE